jgi:hypothetical protein
MSSFTTTTRKSTTEINCDINTAYSIDDLFSPSTPTAINYAQQQLLDQNKATSTGVPNFDCLPLQHSNNNNHAGGIVPTLPIESLSINHHNTINQEWMSPMELNYSEYNQPDMNCKKKKDLYKKI